MSTDASESLKMPRSVYNFLKGVERNNDQVETIGQGELRDIHFDHGAGHTCSPEFFVESGKHVFGAVNARQVHTRLKQRDGNTTRPAHEFQSFSAHPPGFLNEETDVQVDVDVRIVKVGYFVKLYRPG